MARDCVTHHNACDCREERFRELEAENERLRRLAPLCDSHGTGLGARSDCPYCALIVANTVLSEIDYLCGEPNDMGVSDFDVHHNERAVLEKVRRRLGLFVESQGKPSDWPDDFDPRTDGDGLGVHNRE